MRKFIIIVLVLLVWIFIVVPLMLDVFRNYRNCCGRWEEPLNKAFDKIWAQRLLHYIPGVYSPLLGGRVPRWFAGERWDTLFKQVRKTDWIVIVIVSAVFFWLTFIDVQKSQRRRVWEFILWLFKSAKKALKKELRPFLGDDGLVLSKRLRLKGKYDYEHVLLVGSANGSKVRSYAIPNLLENLPGSIVVTDPTGELFKYTSAYQESIGKKLLIFSPQYPKYSFFYNPLHYCSNDTETRGLALTILNNGDISPKYKYIAMVKNFLSATLIWAQRTGKTIAEGFDAVISRDTDELDVLFNQGGYGLRDYRLYRQSLDSPEIAASIRKGMIFLRELWIDDNVRMVTSENEFDFAQIRKKPHVIYVMVSVSKMGYFKQLLSAFFKDLFSVINSEDKSDLPVHFILNEFTNIGRIPDFEHDISICGNNRISISIIVSDMAQLDQIYGRDAALILSRIKTKIALPGLTDSANYFSELAEGTTANSVYTSASRPLFRPITYPSPYGKRFSRHLGPLCTPDEIMTMPDSKCQVYFSGTTPFYDDQNRYDMNSAYREKVKEQAPKVRKLPELKTMGIESAIAKTEENIKDAAAKKEKLDDQKRDKAGAENKVKRKWI